MHRVRPQPFFKHLQPSATVQRRLRKQALDNDENAAKARVRRRDKGCRFPLCGCRRLRLSLEVSHNEHKGSGGDPSGARSQDKLLMQLCRERHRTNPFSVHNQNLKWEPLSKREGSNGLVRWLLDVKLAHYYMNGATGQRPSTLRLVEVAREVAVGHPIVNPRHQALLEELATMKW